MKNIKLTIEYVGQNYCGWQKQKNGLSIQEVITSAIFSVTGEKVALSGSGRTDSGVHAAGQVANFQTTSTIPPDRFSLALNAILPQDISIVSSEEVREDFHSRYSAVGKTYRYYIWNAPTRSAIFANNSYFVDNPLDINVMNISAQSFVGIHDFKAFMASGSKVKSTEREILSAKVFPVRETFSGSEGNLICIEVTGTGFLYNMVRIISGTLMEVGLGKYPLEKVKAALEIGDRKLAGQTLPACGLFLYKVFY